MRRLPVLSAVLLAVLLGPVAGAHAAAPKVVRHTYDVRYDLSGTYHAETVYDGSAFYCAASGFAEDVDFHLKIDARVKVKLDGEALVSKTVLPDPDIGTWKMKGKTFPDNQCSEPVQDQSCGRGLRLRANGGVPNTLLAAGRKTKVGFVFSLEGPPDEDNQPSDCGATSDASPPPSFLIASALGPYDHVQLAIPLEQLARHRRFSGTAKPTQIPSGYSATECGQFCAASLTNLKHTISVKQLDR